MRASKLSVLKLTEIISLWVYYTIPFGFTLFRHLLEHQFLNYLVLHRITGEGLLPEMRIWSILLIQSYFKWCIHLSRSLFFIFQLLCECHCRWTRESPKAHVARFYDLLRLIRSDMRASTFSLLKLTEIVILGFFTIPVGLTFFETSLCLAHNHWLGFSIHLSRSLLLYYISTAR